jgi:carboxyl-terminal processing protease
MKTRFMFAAMLGGLLLTCITYAQDHFAGVGLMLAVKKDALTIIHVLPDTPAAKAGLSEGLLVQKIDGTTTQGKPLQDCVEMVRGAAGSKVKLELVDTANRKTNTVELTRETIPTH